MLLVIGAAVVVVFLLAAGVVVLREINQTTEVEAAPSYSSAEATAFVISGLPDETLRRMRRSEVQGLVDFCLGLLERAGVALGARRPKGDELGGEEMVLDVDGLAQAMRQGMNVATSDSDLEEVAGRFLEYLSAIGAIGKPCDDDLPDADPGSPISP
jgi:hypothetical protein